MTAGVVVGIRGDSVPLQTALADAERSLAMLGGRAQGFGAHMSGAFNRSGSSLEAFLSKLKALGGTIAFVFATSKIIGFGREFIRMADVQIEAETKLEAVMKATGNAAGFTAEQLKQNAAALQKITVYGDETIIGMQAVLSTFREVKGDQFLDATKAALDMSAVLGTDLRSAALQLGKALNDPKLGITALTRSGVSFTEAQKEQIKTLQESGDIMGAQTIIINELKKEFGGAAEALGNTFSGKRAQLANRLGDIEERLGMVAEKFLTLLVPAAEKSLTVLENLTTLLENNLQPALDSTSEAIESLSEPFQQFVAGMVATYSVVEWFTGNFTKVFKFAFDQVSLSISLWTVETIQLVRDWSNSIEGVFVDLTAFLQTTGVTIWGTVYSAWSTGLASLKELVLSSTKQIQMAFAIALGTIATSGVVFAGTKDWFTKQAKEQIEGVKKLEADLNKVRSEAGAEQERIAIETQEKIDAIQETALERKSGIGNTAFDKALEGSVRELEKKRLELPLELTDLDSVIEKNASAVAKLFNKELEVDPNLKPNLGDRENPEDASKDKKGKGAEFVGLEELNKKITAAAFGSQDPAIRGARAAEQQVDQLRQNNQQLQQQNANLEELLAATINVGKQVRYAGALG